MKIILSTLILLALSTSSAHAVEQVLFDVNTKASLENFSLFAESPESVVTRPGIQLTQCGIEGKPGDGNFTAYKFADLISDRWTLKITLQIPAGVRYSNSGIYLLYNDPKANQNELGPLERAAFQDALNKGKKRRALYGAGPFELDYFSHEVQIIAGTDATIPPENHGAAALYGVDIGHKKGQQIKKTNFTFTDGYTYEITVVSTPYVIKTYARAINTPMDFEALPQAVSVFRNVKRSKDPIRGGSPIALLLQGFYNNGKDVQLPIFKRITLEQ